MEDHGHRGGAGGRGGRTRLYAPEAFRELAPERLWAHAAEYPFATVVTQAGGEMLASELPLLVDPAGSELRGHVAVGNPQREHLAAGADALVVFHGPHGYVSPSVYEGQRGVPTWNYVVVQARGPAALVDGAATIAILDETVARFDTTGWKARFGDDWPDVPRDKLAGIVGFRVAVQVLEGKWKLSQNRSPEDQARVVEWLERGDDAARSVAELMRTRRSS